MAQFTRVGSRIVAVAAGLAVMGASARMAMPAEAVLRDSHVSSSPGVDVVPVDNQRVVPESVASDRQQGVTLSVPATAVIRVDLDGRVLAAMTNTGSAPGALDDVWVMHLDGSMQPATAEQFAAQQWIGDFSEPGVYVDQGR